MNYFSFFRKAKVLKKAFSLVALVALAAGGVSGIAYTSTAYANNGISVSAVPNSGTLTPGQSMEVHLTVALDPNDTNPVVADSCLVNGVDVTSTYANLTSGTNGDFKFTYTVGASDASRAAGQVPINCTLRQTHPVTVTAFDDSNTVAIDTSSGGSTGTTTPSTGDTGTTTPSGGTGSTTLSISSTAIFPNFSSLHTGNTAQVIFSEASGAQNLSIAGTCKVNAIDVSGSFQNLGSGRYGVLYTVGPQDGERPAGHIPVTCTLGNGSTTATASAWTDGNTLSIDTNNDGVIDNGTNILGFTISANPSSGTLHAGDSVTVNMQDPLPSGDVVIGQPEGCKVNGKDVASTYAYHGNGLYSVTYTVGAGDTARAQGTLSIDCRLQNQTGSVHLTYFTDNNTLAVDSSSAGGTGTTTPSTGGTGTTTSAMRAEIVPSTGTYHAGQTVELHLFLSPDMNNLTPFGSCYVNNKNVTNTFQNVTDGQYRFNYVIGSTDAERAAGHIPVNCALRDAAGNIHAVSSWADGNTVALDVDQSGTITEPAGNETPFLAGVFADPTSGTLHAGDALDVYFQEGTGVEDFTLNSCTVNGKDVAGTFENLTSGFYKVRYTVASGDQGQAAGTIPMNCKLTRSGGPVFQANGFTDGNLVAIDAGGSTGGTGTTTPSTGGTSTTTPSGGTSTTTPSGGTNTATSTVDIFWTSPTPNSGTLKYGDLIQAYFQETNLRTDLSLNGACTINGVEAGPLENLGSGLYRLNYRIGQNDADRPAGTVPINCALKNSAGGTATITAFANNTLAIDVNGNGSYSDTGGTATTTPSTGDTGTTTPSTGGTGTTTPSDGSNGTSTPQGNGTLAVDSIMQTRSSAVPGAGFDSGWSWTFKVTVPTNEPVVQVKFGDWTHSNGSTTIPMANNMRISSVQASSTAPVTMSAAGIYSDPLVITGDLDPALPGRQIELKVDMRIPSDAAAGAYGTYYGIQSSQE